MITQDLVGVPFDVNAYRLIRYEPTAAGLARLRVDLAGAVAVVATGEEGAK